MEYFLTGRFFVDLIFKHLVLDNVTSWRVFNKDQQIIEFFTNKGTFKDVVIYNDEHDKYLNDFKYSMINIKTNKIPKNIVSLENIFDQPE